MEPTRHHLSLALLLTTLFPAGLGTAACGSEPPAIETRFDHLVARGADSNQPHVTVTNNTDAVVEIELGPVEMIYDGDGTPTGRSYQGHVEHRYTLERNADVEIRLDPGEERVIRYRRDGRPSLEPIVRRRGPFSIGWFCHYRGNVRAEYALPEDDSDGARDADPVVIEADFRSRTFQAF